MNSSFEPDALRMLVEGSGLSYDENSVSWIFTCPRCSKPKKFYLRKKDGRFVCWRCKETDNFQGKPEYGLGELLGMSIGDVRRKLYGDVLLSSDPTMESRIADFFGDGDSVDDEAFEHDVIKWPYDFYPIEDEFHCKRGMDYLKSRGIPKRIAIEYGLRYSPELRRVYFPVSEQGNLYGYQGRLIVPHEYVDEETGEEKQVPKILGSKSMHRDRTLMFVDRMRNSDHVILCEGPVDAIKAHFCGGNVATMGKEISRHQIQMILNSGVKRVYIALDPDAYEVIEKLIAELSHSVELYEMVPQRIGGKIDLGAMTFREVYDLFLGAERFLTRLFIDLNF